MPRTLALTRVLGLTSAVTFVLTASAALAIGPEPAPAPPKKCSQHKQGTNAWKKCMGQQKLRDDDEAYAVGYWLAKAGDYGNALDALRSASNQADPRIQTMIGFSLRMLGHVDDAMAYYHAALAANPDLTTTRQYLGEAHLQKADRAGAMLQLAEIERRCGVDCSDYRLLAEKIGNFRG